LTADFEQEASCISGCYNEIDIIITNYPLVVLPDSSSFSTMQESISLMTAEEAEEGREEVEPGSNND